MKRCPQCNHIATDDLLAFCRTDGVRLVNDGDSSTDDETAALVVEAPVARTSVLEESLNQRAATRMIDSAWRTSLVAKLIGTTKRRITVAAVVSILALLLAGSAYYSSSRTKNDAITSVAVLPFINVNADPQLEYLSDGMTEMLIYDLSRLPALNVKARASVFQYKGKDVTPRTIGADLNVQAVLSGRIMLHGEVLTLSLEMADARTENVIWSEQYDSKQAEIVSLQSEVARDVSDKLRMKLSGADQRRLSNNYTKNAEAYQLYLKGRFYWNKRTAKDLEKAIDYFNQAAALDQNYALAYAGLADSYVLLPFYRDAPIGEGMRQARDAATKALSLDSNLVEAHVSLGFVNTCESDFSEAQREFKLAIELNPNYATAHIWCGVMLSYLGRHREALLELQRALEIDPLSLIANVRYGEGLFYARRYDEAIAQLKKAIELDADFERAHSTLSTVYQAKGSYAEAVDEYARYQELMGQQQTATLVRASFAKGGWQEFLRTMTGGEKRVNLSRYNSVVFLTALGEKDKAFTELEMSFEVFGRLLKVDPLLDPLRDDARFAALLRRVGLPTA